jgi:hypothetical protein
MGGPMGDPMGGQPAEPGGIPPGGFPPGGLPPPGPPGEPYPAYQPGQPRRQNTMAIIALVLSLVGFIIGISAPVGAILGHVARKQIRETGESGEGMALAAIIVGWVLTGLLLIGCCIVAVALFAGAGTQRGGY